MNIFKKSSQRFSSFRNLAGLIISFGCIYWSFANFNFDEFINYYKSINYFFFIIAIIVLIFSVIIRSIRWSLFFKEEELYNISLFELFKNQMIGYFGSNIFPFKLGDLFANNLFFIVEVKVHKVRVNNDYLSENNIDMAMIISVLLKPTVVHMGLKGRSLIYACIYE